MIIVIISFGFPVLRSKPLYPGIKHIETLKHYSASENIQIYDATGVMPELVFEYGKEIPLILSSQDLKAIQKKRFGILVNEEFTPNYKAIFKDFNLKFIDSIDLNPVLSKKENNRLVRKLYLATVK